MFRWNSGRGGARAAQIIAATLSRPRMRASERTSFFWSSRSWNSSGIAARIGLAPGVDLAGDGAQRGLDRRPVTFLRGSELQAILDSGDLRVAEQRVILLRRWLVDSLRLRRRSNGRRGGGLFQLRHADIGRRGRRIGLAQRRGKVGDRRLRFGLELGLRRRWHLGLRRLVGRQRKTCDRQPILLAFLVGERGAEPGFGCDRLAARHRDAVPSQNTGGGGADDQDADQRDEGNGSGQKRLHPGLFHAKLDAN